MNESYRRTLYYDPNLLGSDFLCAGSDVEDVHPAGRGPMVGKEMAYATYDEDNKIVEDRSGTPLRGCRYREGSGVCGKGKKPCPVASVVDIKTFNDRVEALKQLDVK